MIYIVDDDQIVRRSLSMVLKNDFDVVSFSSAVLALEALEETKPMQFCWTWG